MNGAKVTIGSPDGLGDFVLRIPLLDALLAADCRLQLVMRPPAADLARELFPGAEILALQQDPFRQETKKQRHGFRQELEAIRRFRPDLYVASAFQLNFFDEVFLTEVPEFVAAGFCSEDDFWPSDTSVDPRDLARRFAPKVTVPTAMPEGKKNRLLAGALTGQVPGDRAGHPPSPVALEQAKRILEEHGLRPGEFSVVCAGSRPGLVMKDWGERNWAALLGEIGTQAGTRFVFLGNTKEHASVSRLCAALPPTSRPVNLAVDPPPVPVSHALISLARSYLGRDSGLMHLAALSGVPLLAVFSGAHWPRFVPEAERGIVLTSAAPCQGCNFHCPFPEPWCVKKVAVDAVAEAWRDLPDVSGLRIVELPPGEQWLSMARELDVPAYAREQAAAARAAIADLRNEGVWRKLFAGLTAR